jgi:hypothetical protein
MCWADAIGLAGEGAVVAGPDRAVDGRQGQVTFEVAAGEPVYMWLFADDVRPTIHTPGPHRLPHRRCAV